MSTSHVDATDPVVADLLSGILEVLAAAGGWLHPQARLVEREGHLRLHCLAPEGEPLVRVPHAAMVPVGRLSWAASPDALALDDLPEDLDPLATELAYLEVALLNQCGKVPQLQLTHPLIAPLEPGLIEAVQALRPGFRVEPIDPTSLLWSTRCFRLTVGAGPAEPVVIPVVDLLDHHAAGATGTGQADSFGVTVRHVGTGDACFLDYGWKRDAIGMALTYGFADSSADLAHSAPLSVDLGLLGRLEILGKGRDADGHLLPMQATRLPGGVALSHVSFGIGFHPVHQVMEATGWEESTATSAVEAVASANLVLLDALIDQAVADGRPASRVLADAAGHQQWIIRTFPEHARDLPLT